MPRVPEYQSQVSRATPTFNAPTFRVPTVATKPQAAFGGAEASANAMLGEAVSRAGQALSGIAVKKMKMNAEKEALKLSTEFQTRLDDMLYSSETEDITDKSEQVITRPVGILNRKQGLAKDAGVNFDGSFAELMKEFEGRPGSGYEQAIFDRMAQGHYIPARNSVFRHQAREELAEYKAVMAAGLEKIKQSATQYVNATDLLDGIDRAQAINATGMRNLGQGDTEIENANASLAGEIAKTAITSMLEKEPMRAQAIFEAVKDEIPNAGEIGGIIQGKLFADQRIQVWEAMGGMYRRADGSYDKEAMRAGIMGLPGFDTDKKENLVNYAEARANDSEAAFRKGNAANDRACLNKAITMQKQGVPLDEILKVATEFGRDAADVRAKERAIKKMQDTIVTNPDTEWALYTGIRDGAVTESQLDDNKDQLSGNDYLRLRKELNKSVESPQTNIATKGTWKRIQDMARRKYTNKRKMNEFLTEVAREFSDSGGGTPDQLWTLANDKLKGVKTGWLQIFEGMLTPSWEIDAEKNKALSLLKGKLENDLGRETMNKIAIAIRASTGKDSVDIVDINEFADAVGGIDAIRPGTPGYKAIQALMEYDPPKRVTPESIKFVISKHPEWK